MSTATQGIARINTTIEILWLLFIFKQERVPARPAQLAELPRSAFDPELFPDKNAIFSILQQNVTNFDIGNG